jgi:hypothetical protein
MIKHCLNCGAELKAEQCEACGLTAAAAEAVLGRGLLQQLALFLLGAVAFLAASHLYPPLELDRILIFVGLLFFLTLLLGVWLVRRVRRRAEVEALKRVYHGLVPVLWVLAALLFVNGRFDASPPASWVTAVVGKFTMPGTLRSSRLVVTSWRQGQHVERVPVSRDDYARFRHGDTIEVQMKEGLVGIPWVYDVHRK